jgi:hypothetical protein
MSKLESGPLAQRAARHLNGKFDRQLARQSGKRGLTAKPVARPPRGVLKRWEKWEIDLVGTQPDRELSRRLERTFFAVKGMRARLKRPMAGFFKRRTRRSAPRTRARRKLRFWTAAEDALLGTAPDRVVARRLTRSVASVAQRRNGLGVPPVKRPGWSPAEDALLGTLPDKELAARLGRSRGAVRGHRCLMGVAAFWQPAPGAWTAAEDALLGKFTDRQVAQRLGRARRVVAYRRCKLGIRPLTLWRPWTKREIALLGTARDAELARKLRHPLNSIADKRLQLGIPALPPLRRWTPVELRLLGRLPDSEVARRTGRDPSYVRRKRRLSGIPYLARQRPRSPAQSGRKLSEKA